MDSKYFQKISRFYHRNRKQKNHNFRKRQKQSLEGSRLKFSTYFGVKRGDIEVDLFLL